ncbi:uncharacterized protein LOC121865517 [Homarus americanus]
MNGTTGPSLVHHGLSRPKPKRNHKPSPRPKVTENVVRDSSLDNFFPSVSQRRPGDVCSSTGSHSSRSASTVATPQSCIDAGCRDPSPPLPLVGEEYSTERLAAAVEGDSLSKRNNGGENRIAEKSRHLRDNKGKREGGGECEDNGKFKTKTGREGNRSIAGRNVGYLQHEQVITTKGRSVISLVRSLELRLNIHSPCSHPIKDVVDEQGGEGGGSSNHDNGSSSADEDFTPSSNLLSKDDSNFDEFLADDAVITPGNHSTFRKRLDEELAQRIRLHDETLALRRPAAEEVNLRRPVDEEVTLRRPVDEEVTLRRPAAEEVNLRRPVAEEVTLRRPMDEEVTLRKPADEEVTLRRPVAEEVTLRKPADEEVTLRRPVAEEVTLRRPMAEEVNLRRPVDEEVTLRRPVDEEVTLRRPAAEEVNLRRPVDEEVTLRRPVDEEVTLRRLKKP